MRKLLSMPAPPPPLVVETPAEAEAPKERPAEFFEKDNVPADDAPIEDLLTYWSRWLHSPRTDEPSNTVKQRLFDATSGNIEHLTAFLPVLAGSESIVAKAKEVFDRAEGNKEYDQQRAEMKEWLVLKSKYFLDELLERASNVKDDVKEGNIHNKQALEALAKLDWPTAEPLLRNLAATGQPRSASLALTLLYEHASRAGNVSYEEKLRSQLQAVASDRSQPGRARNVAIEALAQTSWSGRDDWYLSLLNDESLVSLNDGSTGMSPLSTVFALDPDKWIPLMTKMVGSTNRTIQQGAASCLVRYAISDPRRDAILPVLRWLSEPEWLGLGDTERAWFMQKMDKLDLPESVPGLIWIVENEESNARWAARTLAFYKDPRAIPALKKALAKVVESDRTFILEGLFACGGVTEAEAVDALEAYAAKLSTPEGTAEVERYTNYDEELSIPLSIGKFLALKQDLPQSLVRAVLARVASLKKRDPALAQSLLQITHQWRSRQIDLDIVQRIAAGTANADTIANALNRRNKLRENLGVELRTMLQGDSVAEAISSVLLNDEVLAQTVLSSGEQLSQVALLAAARLTQTRLPVEQVGALLKSKNALLALAAERYLLVEDSKEARTLLWQQHPGEAFITGWRESDDYFGKSPDMDKLEEKLRAELFKENGPSEIYALISHADRHDVLRVYADRASYTQVEDSARYMESVVSKAEVATFKQFVTTSGLSELGPQLGYCHHFCPVSEFLMLTKESGRRLFDRGQNSGIGSLIENLDLLGRAGGPRKIHYKLEQQIKGLKVLYGDKDPIVEDVWQQDNEIRVLVERAETDEERETVDKRLQSDDEDGEAARVEARRKEAAAFRARFSWRKLTGDKLGEITTQPEAYVTIDESRFQLAEEDEELFRQQGANVQRLTADSTVFTRTFEGLWKQFAGSEAVRVGKEDGAYGSPIVSPDGKWVVASRTDDDWIEPNYVVRINMQTGRELRIKLQPADDFEPIAFLPLHNKVLLRRAKEEDGSRKASIGPDRPEYYLLDPKTGETRLVSGEFAPLLEERKRFLQATEKPEEFWAAIPEEAKDQTQVGRYNLKSFSFTPVLTVLHISFNSSSMWIDEKQSKVYLIYKEQLLSIPLKAQP